MTAVMVQQFEKYANARKRLFYVLTFSMLLNLSLASILLYWFANPPQADYFATSVNGEAKNLVALEQPNQSDASVLQWANQAAISSFSYNFVDYKEELQAASGYFTPKGWREFNRALRASKSIDDLLEKKLIVSAVATGAPIILEKGPLSGRYTWRVQIPLLINYQSASDREQQHAIADMMITRVPTKHSVLGVGIVQFNLTRVMSPGLR